MGALPRTALPAWSSAAAFADSDLYDSPEPPLIDGALLLVSRYHLNIFNGEEVIDDEGLELPDLAAAMEQAINGARALIAADVLAGVAINFGHRIVITDDEGKMLSTVPFGDVITIVQP